jgi:hypothetical protein
MKNIILLTSLILFSATTGFSQEVTKQKEIGISFYNFDSFGIFYRTGKPSAMWRFNSAYGSAYNNESKNNDDIDKTKGFSFSLSAGREYRKVLIENLEGRVGFDVSLGYQQFKNDRDNPSYTYTRKYKTFSPGANAVLGLNYIIKQKMIIGVELSPGFYYTTGEDVTEDTNGNNQTYDIDNIGFSLTNIARISIAYRF